MNQHANRRFLNNVFKGENASRYYTLVLGGVVIYWLLFSYITMVVTQGILAALGFHELIVRMVGEAMPFAVVMGWLLLTLSRWHGRTWRSLINAERTINYRRVAQGFCVWGLQLAIGSGLDIAANPEDYRLQFQPGAWLLLLVLSLCLVPIQTSAEELLYRGYLMQALRLLTKRPFWLIAITSLAFAIPHFGNPEMARGAFIWGALNYFAWGVVVAVITLKDNGLELALGLHAANNLFGYLFITTPDSVVQSPAIWIYEQTYDPMLGFFGLLIAGAIFYAIFFGGIPRPRISDRT